MIISEYPPFFETKKLNLFKVILILLLSTLLLFSYTKPVSAANGTACAGLGPFGLPGLDLPPEQIGEWGEVLTFPVPAIHSIVLSSGKVLFWLNALPPYLFDPLTETYEVAQSPAFDTSVDFFCAGHATMADGRVMVAGGTVTGAGTTGIPDAFIFDPVTETWEKTASMAESRWYPTITTLLDGRILSTSGRIIPGSPSINALFPEIYDPELGTWTTLTSAGRNQPLYPFTYALPDGTAVDSGPGNVYTLDVASEEPIWTRITNIIFTSGGAGESSAMYKINQILKIGSVDSVTGDLDRALVLDMSQPSPAWREIPPMNFPRRRADIVLLANGKAMVTGGAIATQNDHDCAVYASEIWDPETEEFTVVASQDQARIYHSTSVLLPDGRILTSGGEGVSGGKTAEIYSPPYLFKGVRPVISNMPTAANYGTSFTVDTADAPDIASISLLRPAAITHNFDENQRFLSLDFTVGEGQLTVTAPAAENTPPGDYMLFLINTNGAVSVAKFIRLTAIDTDLDGIFDHEDNCTLAANGPLILDAGGNSQLDTDNDGFGNMCDADLNNDNIVNSLDLGLFKIRFSTTDADADINGDGIVNSLDLGLFKSLFFKPPGPSGPLP
ncbi:hypothetical protein MNBD_GAMMA08-306 [hydrothermal vent metagenome]|uniref:Dockerin domain-containing protein n=1 Tax=hydrothermal vent metagenome TaxID=652676 RepID=A0A3B0XCI1_9ZZZZ